METKSILQIVSGFKPSVDGMGDFSRRLGDALWKRHSIKSHFLVYRRPKTPLDLNEISPNTLSYPADSTPSAFLEHVEELRRQQHFDHVLLNYGGYAYDRDGKPAAFTTAIETLAQSMRFMTFFHEVYATGAPWKRAFWTRREQRNAASTLLRISDVSFTSNIKYRHLLEPLNKSNRELIQIPIFSNIGEPENLLPLEKRERTLVVFGQLVTRVRLYKDRKHILEDVCRRLRIRKIVDVGSGTSPFIPNAIAGAEVHRSGWMDEQQLSDLMSNSIAGIIGYWPDVWEKSGVLAAYSAHALVSIMEPFEKREFPKPAFVPFLSADEIVRLTSADGVVSDASLQGVADAAHSYYIKNQSVNRCAEVIARFATHP